MLYAEHGADLNSSCSYWGESAPKKEIQCDLLSDVLCGPEWLSGVSRSGPEQCERCEQEEGQDRWRCMQNMV
jgi:hypothetical protein